MQRRELLRVLGATTALALIPGEAFAAWTRVASGVRPANGLTEAQLARVAAIADTILPRTDTPSASDVGVPDFVNVIVSENYRDAERDAFVAGLEQIDPAEIASIESATDRRAEPARTYWRLKGLVVHGYFTSERVMKDVLHYEVMPGKFDGDAPMPLKSARATRGGGHSHG
ncbi:MAG TPA: gluconate 2-dehydrogenase subunit 3 family protein [Gemmatimonadaceae bacterium]|nr:gluconate 2-dehydrogenase subunit 3 family protein [Gemmatimonadaceae bacterium]